MIGTARHRQPYFSGVNNPNPGFGAHKSGRGDFLFSQRLTRSYQKALARRPLSMNLQVVQRSETKELILGEAFSSLCGVGLNDRCNIPMQKNRLCTSHHEKTMMGRKL
jgi:hypothetical protein